MKITDTLTTKSEQRLQAIIALTQHTIKVGVSALNKFPTAEYEVLVFTFINYLERFTYALESIEILLNNFKEKPNVETAIGLTIRASLLDFITIIYISSYQVDITPENPKGQEEFDKIFDELVSDQVSYTIKFLKLMKSTSQITQDEFELAIRNLNHTYNFLFTGLNLKDLASTLKAKPSNSPTKFFKRILQHTATEKFAMAYDLYIYYSKYEHSGIMTHFMQRQSINQDLDRIIWSINYIVRGIAITLSNLNHPTNKLTTERKQLNNLILEFDKLVVTNKPQLGDPS